jgi:hypothetical protein
MKIETILEKLAVGETVILNTNEYIYVDHLCHCQAKIPESHISIIGNRLTITPIQKNFIPSITTEQKCDL